MAEVLWATPDPGELPGDCDGRKEAIVSRYPPPFAGYDDGDWGAARRKWPRDERTIRLKAERGESGWWYVTSPDNGLLVAAPTLGDALVLVPQALEDLKNAH